MSDVKLYKGDCLVEMNKIADKSVDMILCDLPYGTTQNKWDSIIPFNKLWEQYNRIIKDNGAIVLFCDGLFQAKLILSNESMWRYNLVWNKVLSTGFLNANRMPMRIHEEISVFYKNLGTYNPQKFKGNPLHGRGSGKNFNTFNCYGVHSFVDNAGNTDKYPVSILEFQKPHPSKGLHPTEKPTDLLEYLILTYTNENETILDNCMGSGSTGVAAVNTNRNFIGIELDDNYFSIAEDRINVAIRENDIKLF
jgi:DNA modification methylase